MAKLNQNYSPKKILLMKVMRKRKNNANRILIIKTIKMDKISL